MTHSLLADIGGTNARFAVVDEKGAVSRIKIYAVRENPTLMGALESYRKEECADLSIKAVAMAIAGPILGDRVPLTNSDWVCDKTEIANAVGTPHVFILNDFEAIAVAIGSMKAEDTIVLQTGQPLDFAPRLVMGPGTGLGIAALKPVQGGGFEAIRTEGGHVRYAPANDREHQMIRLLSRELSFVSAEDLISGPGIVNLYKANCMLVGEAPELSDPAAIVQASREGNPLCKQVLGDFAAIFGSVASQMALSYIALGGVYLTGGVLEKLGADFDQSRFLERFATNPKMASLLARAPVYRVKASIPAFEGLERVVGLLL
ncbi:MAG: glucokinase [Bdellovibrionales bacterium]|jgi:glucokinase